MFYRAEAPNAAPKAKEAEQREAAEARKAVEAKLRKAEEARKKKEKKKEDQEMLEAAIRLAEQEAAERAGKNAGALVQEEGR